MHSDENQSKAPDKGKAMMQFEVDRDNLHRTRVLDEAPRAVASGEVRLRIDHFALTSNNITYAAFGDMLQYWNFFPASAPDSESGNWGRVPVWGFAEVVESTVGELALGARVYGYFPMSTELIVEPGRFDGSGFTDVAEHRQPMAAAYNRYLFAETDPMYDPNRESQQMVLWPLFMTSFLIDDFLGDNAMFDAQTVVVSSASSKTAIGAAYQASQREGVQVVGLTSAGNADVVRSLGCYHETVLYDDVANLEARNAVFVDIAGNADVRAAVHGRFGEQLKYSMIVGSTHWDHEPTVVMPKSGAKPEFFFAPTQISKRNKEWGKDGLDERVGSAWRNYSAWTDGWIAFETMHGASGTEQAFRALLNGNVDPKLGYVVTP